MKEPLQFLNRITLVGYVGAVHTTDTINPIIRMQVVTNFAYKNQYGTPVIETTWMPITLITKKNKLDIYKNIKKGDAVKVVGRIRNFKKILQNGQEMNDIEVLASSIKKLDLSNSLLFQIK